LILFIKPTTSLWSLFLSYYFFQLFHLFLFLVLFHNSFTTSTSCNWAFCIFTVASLINSSFTSFLFCLPIPYFFISLFLVLSLLLISNLILAVTTKRPDSISATLILLTSQIFVQYVLSNNVWSTLLHILLSGDGQVTLWMSLRWYHVPVTVKIHHSFSIIICFVVKPGPSTCWVQTGLFF